MLNKKRNISRLGRLVAPHSRNRDSDRTMKSGPGCNRGRLRDERGSALMAGFWMLVVLLLAGLAASFTTTTEVRLAGNNRLKKQLFYLAEAGIEQVKKEINALGMPFEGSGAEKSAPVQVALNTPLGATGSVTGTYTAYVDPQNNLGGMSTKFLAITVRARIGNSAMTAVLQEMVGQDNFAKYAYFTNEERMTTGTIVWFTTGDILRGPVHSNSQFNINGDPIFFKHVSSTASSINWGGGTDNPDFKEGISFDADPIELPNDTSMISVKAQEADGLYLAGDQELWLDWDPVTEFASVIVDPLGAATVLQLPLNGVIYVDGDLRIKGTLRGQLTVACSGDMYIIDDILYTTDPRVDPSSTDLLGLVSDGDVYVADTPENLDSGDETIMAAIMALDLSFTAQNYAAGTPRGYLRVIGGIIQTNRGPVGTFNWSGIVSGYEKDYVYDTRLADNPPPAFPTTGKVLTLAWKQLDPSIDISSDVF